MDLGFATAGYESQCGDHEEGAAPSPLETALPSLGDQSAENSEGYRPGLSRDKSNVCLPDLRCANPSYELRLVTLRYPLCRARHRRLLLFVLVVGISSEYYNDR